MSEPLTETAPRGSALAQLGNLFVAPAQALDYAGARPRMWWLPLAVVLILVLVLGLWVAFSINIEAWRAIMMQFMAQANPKAAEYIAHAGRGSLLFQTLIGLVSIVVIELLYALYLFLADKLFSAANRGYGQWFSFTTWVSLPIAISPIAGMIAWAFANHATGIPQMDVTSLNSLLFHLKPGNPLYSVAQFSILQFWVIGLATFGLTRWCGHSIGKALAIAIAPYVVFYGIFYLI